MAKSKLNKPIVTKNPVELQTEDKKIFLFYSLPLCALDTQLRITLGLLKTI